MKLDFCGIFQYYIFPTLFLLFLKLQSYFYPTFLHMPARKPVVVKWGEYSPVKFANFVYICITRGENNHFWAESGYFYRAYTNIYKICELHRAIFSSLYNISQPNFAVLLILKAHTDRTRFGNATRIFSFQWHLTLIFFNDFQIFGTT
jgi:hypothetical protein